MKVIYATYQQEEFDATLVKLNKKLAKIAGTTPVEVVSSVPSRVFIGNDSFLEPVYQDVIEVELSVPVSTAHAGYEYRGTLSSKDGVETIFAVNDYQLTHITEKRCDHCNHKRQRKVVHVFTDETGAEKVIGSSCVDEYFGVNIEKALKIFNGAFTDFKDYAEDEEYMGGGCSFRGYSIQELLFAILYVYAGNSTYRKVDTRMEVEAVFTDIKNKALDRGAVRNKAIAKMGLEEIKNLLAETYGDLDVNHSNFNFNMKQAVFVEGKTVRSMIPLKVTGLFIYAVFNAFNKVAENEVRQAKAKARMEARKDIPNVHIGSLKDKIQVTGVVTKIREIETMYGISHLFIMDTTEGQVKMFTTSTTFDDVNEGDNITVKGTVKDHEVYGEEKSTLLNRVKVV